METTNVEKFKIVTKQWARYNDVMSLTGCSKSKAYKILTELKEELLRENKKPIAPGVISMERVLQHLEISKTAIYKAALQEKELFGLGGNPNGIENI